MHDKLALIAISTIPGLGPRRILKLVETFGSPEAAIKAGMNELCQAGRLSRETAESLKHGINYKKIEKQISELRRNNVALVSLWDPDYPDDHIRMGRMLTKRCEDALEFIEFDDSDVLSYKSSHLKIP